MDDFQHGSATADEGAPSGYGQEGCYCEDQHVVGQKTVKAVADKATGAFVFDLDVPAAGGPYTLTFDDGRKLVLENVMAGEVWFCSGQSNMEMPVKGWGMVNNYEQEVANANHPLVRLFQVKKVVAHTPQTEVPLGHTQGWAHMSLPERCRRSWASPSEWSTVLGEAHQPRAGSAWTGYKASWASKVMPNAFLPQASTKRR